MWTWRRSRKTWRRRLGGLGGEAQEDFEAGARRTWWRVIMKGSGGLGGKDQEDLKEGLRRT